MTAPRRPTAQDRDDARDPAADRFPVADRRARARRRRRASRGAAGGATAAETDVSQAVGQSVTVRKGEVETIAYNRDKGIGVTVYLGQRRGHASTADFSDDAIRATVDKALAIARYTAEDPCAGSPTPSGSRAHGPTSTSTIRGTCPSTTRSRSAARPRPRRWRSTARHHQHRGRDGRARRIGVRLRELARLRRRLPQLAPPHRLLGDRRGRRRDAARLLVHGGARAGRPPARGDVGRIAGERTARRLGAGSWGRSSARCCSRRPKPAT